MKDKDLGHAEKDGSNTEFKIGLGLFVAIVSGVLSACFAFGIDAGKDMADAANAAWKAVHPGQGEFLYQNNVTYIIIMWGGLLTNFIWCMILNFRNKSFSDYTNKKTPLAKNYIFSAIAGTTWFLQFFFYGMGESRLGNGASSWILHMAFIILVANLWGLILKEWKGVRTKTLATVIMGIIIILVSVLVVGYGNSIKI
jgi:L-rhamnose-H+ transport protein